MSIEKNLKSWISHVIQSETRVIQVPYAGKRPDNDYVTFQISSVTPEGNSYDSKRVMSGNSAISETLKYNATLMISVNAYSYQGYDWLNRLHASAEMWSARDILRRDGVDLSLVGMSGARNLTALDDTEIRPRYQGDFKFYMTTANTFEIHRLKQFIITGRWVKDDVIFTHHVAGV